MEAFNKEIFGSNTTDMETIKNPLGVMQERVCTGNLKFYKGFKWKPQHWNDAYIEALRWVAFHRIPVVYSNRNRNPIDVYLAE